MTKQRTPKALLIGAGIGGPVLGAFLRRLDYHVTICEMRDHALTEGAFFAVAPNGMAVLQEIGAAEDVLAAGTVCVGFDFMNRYGQVVATIDTSEDAHRYGHPMVVTQRSAVHSSVLRAAEREGVHVRFGATLIGLDTSDPRVVRATFEDGREEVADFVVGCDGIRSPTRELALPDAPQPSFLQLLDFGGYATESDAPIDVGRNVMVFGRRAFFGAFRRDDGEVWWFHNGGERTPTSDIAHAKQRLLVEHADDPPWVSDLIRATPQLLGPWPMHDIMTMPRWHRGRVCLLGDAAHATSPSSGQGASLAMEDAMMLARSLRDTRDPPSAFAAFVAARRQRVERVVAYSRRISSRKVAGNTVSAWLRDKTLPTFLKLGAAAQRELYSYRIDWTEPCA